MYTSMIKKSITVTEEQDAWIRAQLATGRYASDSEVIREALREKEMRLAEIESIREALIEAESRGVSDRGKDAIKRAVQADLNARGRLSP